MYLAMSVPKVFLLGGGRAFYVYGVVFKGKYFLLNLS